MLRNSHKILSIVMVLILSATMTIVSTAKPDQGNIDALPRRSETTTATEDTTAPKTTTAAPAKSTSGHYHYFGNQLVTSQEQQVYSRMEKELLTGKTETSLIILDPPLKLKSSVNDQKAIELEIITTFKRALDAFKFDHPQMYWITGNSTLANLAIGSDSTGAAYLSEVSVFFEGAPVSSTDIANVNNTVNTIVAAAKQETTHQKRIQTVHDMLAKHITYGGEKNHRAFQVSGAFSDKLATCEGYSKSFKMIMDKLGYDNVLIGGYGYNKGQKIAHMWNYIKVDGNWYAVDVTWDDQGTIVYDYFLAGKNTAAPNFGSRTFGNDHVEEYTFSYLNYKPFTYPQLSGTAYR